MKKFDMAHVKSEIVALLEDTGATVAAMSGALGIPAGVVRAAVQQLETERQLSPRGEVRYHGESALVYGRSADV